jgi:hypothetical protein
MLRTDMYFLLRNYAERVKSPYINIGEFVNFTEKSSGQAETASGVKAQLMDEIPALVESGHCVMVTDAKESGVFVTAYFRERVADAYNDIDKTPGIPFPDATSLKMRVPGNCVHSVSLTADMGVFFGVKKADGEIDGRLSSLPDPQEIIRIHLPDKCGTTLMPAFMIPRRLMEISLMKVGHFLQSSNNKEYMLNKMNSLMHDTKQGMKDFFDKIITNPSDCLSEMERVADFPYLFWTYFCPLVKNDMGRKKDLYPEDTAVLQAVRIIEICSGFYRSIAARKRDLEAAFKILEDRMDNPPYRYTMEEISSFTNEKGIYLLKTYTWEELQAYVKRASGESKNGLLPEWLIMKAVDGKRCFVKKTYYLSICTGMISEVRPLIKEVITDRWTTITKEFSKEAAMDSEAEFNKLLEKQTKIINPALSEILGDPKLFLLYSELERANAVPKYSRIIKDNALIPYSGLYSIKRRDMLTDVRLAIPFWYSIPIIVAIIAFFRGSKRKKGAVVQTATAIPNSTGVSYIPSERDNTEVQKIISAIESTIVPKNRTPDEYLAELEKRWSGLLDINDRQDRISGVNALARENLRDITRTRKQMKGITREKLREMSSFIVTGNAALKTFKDRESLRLYIELYMLKLMANRQ